MRRWAFTRALRISNQKSVGTTASVAAIAAGVFEHDVTLLPGHAGFDVMPDGQHLVFVKPVNGEAPATVVLNWRTELHALVNGRGAK